MRRVLGAMHLALLLPPGCKNLKLVLPYFLVQFKGPTGCALTGNGIYVPASPDFPEGRWIFNEIAFCSNDTRATPLVNLMRQTPALVGASTHHWIDGFKFAAKGASTSYLQAVRFLPPGHELRQWARSFQLAPARVRAVAQQPAPTRKTYADLVRRGRTVDALPPNDEGKRDRVAALVGVYGVDAFASRSVSGVGQFKSIPRLCRAHCDEQRARPGRAIRRPRQKDTFQRVPSGVVVIAFIYRNHIV